jgi:Flp pilus assembly protein TadD
VRLLRPCGFLSSFRRAGVSHHFNKKDYDRAIEDYNAALRIDPNDAMAYSSRGIAYHYKKDYRRARADYEKALQLDPNQTNARDNLESLRKRGC